MFVYCPSRSARSFSVGGAGAGEQRDVRRPSADRGRLARRRTAAGLRGPAPGLRVHGAAWPLHLLLCPTVHAKQLSTCLRAVPACPGAGQPGAGRSLRRRTALVRALGRGRHVRPVPVQPLHEDQVRAELRGLLSTCRSLSHPPPPGHWSQTTSISPKSPLDSRVSPFACLYVVPTVCTFTYQAQSCAQSFFRLVTEK